MEYNTALDKLILPEYGRNVQRLVNHCKSIEDPEFRQAFAERVARLMEQMHPQTKNVEDYQKKIWSEILHIAKYELEVTPPFEDIESIAENVYKRPEKVPYPKMKKSYRHYGSNVQAMIGKAIAMESEEKKAEFTTVIAAYMKMAHKNWNRESSVSDDQIKADLEQLSNGQLKLSEDANLDMLTMPRNKHKKKSHSNHHYKNGSKKGYSKSHNNHHRRKKNY